MFVVRHKVKRKTLDPHKVYLDSCSTYHQFINDDYVSNIHGVERRLREPCNGGTSTISEEGDHGNIRVWFNPEGSANIYSIPRLEEDGCVLSYHTHGEWVVTKPNGEEVIFKKDTGGCGGMPFLNLRESESAVSMVQTIRERFEGYTDREIKDAKLARWVQSMVAHPSDVEFQRMVSASLLSDCPVNEAHASNSVTIFGPNLTGERGKTVRRKPERVDTEIVQILRDFYVLHHFVTLTADVMFVNSIPFLTTLSRKIKLRTAEFLPSRTTSQLSKSLKKLCDYITVEVLMYTLF